MATRAVFTPLSAEFPSSNFPQLTLSNRRPVLAFDAGTDETAYWTGVAPQGLTGTLTLVITYAMASATSGNIYWQAQVEAITDGDATDTDATTSFDTANSGNGAVPGTAGYIDQISITLTNNDSLTAADYFRVAVNRDADNASDTATGDAFLFHFATKRVGMEVERAAILLADFRAYRGETPPPPDIPEAEE